MCLSVSDCKLAFSCWLLPLQPVCFSLHNPDLPSSQCHSFPRPPFGTGKLISPSCRAEFLSIVCVCPSACLSGLPHMGLPLHAGPDLSPAGVPVWEQLLTYAVLYFYFLAFLLPGAHALPSPKRGFLPGFLSVSEGTSPPPLCTNASLSPQV